MTPCFFCCCCAQLLFLENITATYITISMNYPKRPRAKIHVSGTVQRSYVEDLKNWISVELSIV